MPIVQGYTVVKGKRLGFYKAWEGAENKYTYTPGNAKEREDAYNKADKQLKAIKINQNK